MDYDARAQAVAAKKLALKSAGGKGQAIVLTTTGTGTYDPTTRKVTAGSSVVQNGSGIEVAYKAYEINGTTVRAGDRKCMLSPFKQDGSVLTMPSVGDTATVGGVDWRIEDVELVSPAGTPVYAYLQLRKT